MSMIRVEKLTFSYPGSYDEVFRDVSFTIDTDWKLGFVGRNGRGKTTFLKLLMGKYEYQGHITSSAEFDYFPYQVTDKERFTEEIIKEVCPDAENSCSPLPVPCTCPLSANATEFTTGNVSPLAGVTCA